MDATPPVTRGRVLRIVGIAGSLRRGSLNRALLRAGTELAPSTLRITVHDLLPIPSLAPTSSRAALLAR